MTDRPQKITFAEMRESGVRGILGYYADYRCSHQTNASTQPAIEAASTSIHNPPVSRSIVSCRRLLSCAILPLHKTVA